SGTARPAPLPVTRPPMNRRGKVAQTRRTASRCGQTEIAGARADRAPSWAFIFLKPAAALMGARRGGGAEVSILRQPVFFHFGRAVFVGAAIDRRLHFEVAVRRRARRGPFQGVGLP